MTPVRKRDREPSSPRARSLPRRALLVAILASSLAVVQAEESCDSRKCHAKLLGGSTVHAIASTCESCHESVEARHPWKGKKTFKLVQEMPDLCNTCHAATGEGSTVHFPVSQGMCTACHNPHSSGEAKLLLQPQKELCGTCHADHVDFKVVHGPVSAGACTACHSPHAARVEKLLVKKQEELCFGCHLDMQETLEKPNVHAPAQGSCTACHNPHGSDHPKLLSAEGQDLCFLCHGDVKEKVEGSPVVHVAVMSGCPTCHSPHASDQRRLLLGVEKDLCLGCHDGILTKNMISFHGPINEGRCTGCHDPHGNQAAKLLPKEFPADAYVPYTGTEYELCFGCHKRELLQYAETSFATNFRDGERNLHQLHVNNKRKGRSCRLCHNVHGSSNPKLIADSVPFGKWDLPIKYAKTDTGGSCAPGCHKPQHYDRKSPGRKPPGRSGRAVEGAALARESSGNYNSHSHRRR